MAFFKFPWANQAQEPAKGSARRGRASQAESIEQLRRRARHRLIGAAILVLAGVIVFPLIFDTQPRTVPVNVAIDIPDRDAVAPLVAPSAGEKAGEHANGSKLTDDASLSAGEEKVDDAAPKAAEKAPEKTLEKAPTQPIPPIPVPPVAAPATQAKAVQPQAAAKSELKPEPRHEAKPEPKTKVEVTPEPRHAASTSASSPSASDAARARALLEGHAPSAAASAAPAAPAANAQGERFIVQVGAYADQGKVREVRARLERMGIKTYAQDIHGKDGARTTRVRVGPFASRAEAAKTLERIKGAGLDGAVLTL